MTEVWKAFDNLHFSRSPLIQSNDHHIAAVHCQLSSAFQSLRHLTDLRDSTNKRNSLKLEDIGYSDWIYLTQRALMSILESSNKNRIGLGRCCSLAGLLYVECYLRDVIPSSRMVCDLVTRLVSSLQELKLNARHRASDQVSGHWIFWTIFVGAIAAKRSNSKGSSAMREKLMKWLALISGNFTNKPWSVVEKSLRAICWSEKGGKLVGALLWDEITAN